MTTTLDQSTLPVIRGRFAGELLEPGDEGYDEARKIFNGMIDRRPRLIVRCTGAADVVACVLLARETGLPLSIRGGGHGVNGHAVCDDGIMLDLAPMQRIAVDPERRTARAQAGVTGARERGRERRSLLGAPRRRWQLRRRHRVRVPASRGGPARRRRHVDLADRARGRRRAPLPGVHGGRARRGRRRRTSDGAARAVHPARASRKACSGDDRAPPGDLERGEELLRLMREFGPPAVDVVGPMPYTEVQKLLDPGNPPGLFNYWKAELVPTLSDEAIDAVVAHADGMRSSHDVLFFQPLGGQAARIPEDACAINARSNGWICHAIGEWETAAETETSSTGCAAGVS